MLPLAGLLGLGLLLLVGLVQAGWIWDDDSYVTANPVLVEPDGLARIWTPGGTPQFYPMVFMSFWIEARAYGEDFMHQPLGFHLVNWALHLGSSILLWRLLRRLAVPGAWLAAALFLVHPMQVESVAWVSERKNVMAVFLALASVRSWVAHEEAEEGQRAGWYVLSLLLFVAAMLAKTMVATLAPALVALHVWRRRPWTRRDALAVLPFFAVGVPLGLVTAWLERSWVGASGADFSLSALDRIVLAPRSALWYVATWAWPSNLSFVYPRWAVDADDPLQWIAPGLAAAALAVLVVLWRRGMRGPGVLAAIYVGAVFPALGFLNVYPFLFSYVADHFAYVASVALATASGVALAALLRRTGALGRVGCAALLLGLAAMSIGHASAFADEETLWRRTLAANPRAWMPASNLAGMLLTRAGALQSGDPARAGSLAAEAESFARAAIAEDAPAFEPWLALSESLRLQGRLDEALAAARSGLEKAPQLPDLHWMSGRLLELLGRKDEAVESYRQGATLPDGVRRELYQPAQAKTRRRDFARILSQLGRHAEAATAWLAVAALDPDDPEAHANAGISRERAGEFHAAAEQYKAAIAAADPARRPADGQLVMTVMPRLVTALLAAPTGDGDRADALDAARWLVERTGRQDALALLLLARAERAAGIATAAATFAEASRLAADPLLPQALRDEVARAAQEFAPPPGGP